MHHSHFYKTLLTGLHAPDPVPSDPSSEQPAPVAPERRHTASRPLKGFQSLGHLHLKAQAPEHSHELLQGFGSAPSPASPPVTPHPSAWSPTQWMKAVAQRSTLLHLRSSGPSTGPPFPALWGERMNKGTGIYCVYILRPGTPEDAGGTTLYHRSGP